MNRGTINGYALNARGQRGGAFRVAADLIASAYVVAQSRVVRRLTGPLTVSAAIGQGGRRAIRENFGLLVEAAISVTAIPLLRGLFNAACTAVIAASARVGRRSLMTLPVSAEVVIGARSVRRQVVNFVASASLPQDLTSWRLSPEVFEGTAGITLTAGVLNEFPYDEDAPDERVFIVPPEDNVFYVVV
ncbi:hypothetical protein LJR074_001971 [Acidovorax sp. LjRoot74]|uniref:hypothetical protein n=1 Tax=Acidovorax sp. LjRoot74 TaxID=3342337 RepID=UPI003ECC3801